MWQKSGHFCLIFYRVWDIGTLQKSIYYHTRSGPAQTEMELFRLNSKLSGEAVQRRVRNVWRLCVCLVIHLNIEQWDACWKAGRDGVKSARAGERGAFERLQPFQVSDLSALGSAAFYRNARGNIMVGRGECSSAFQTEHPFSLVLQGLCYKLKDPATWKGADTLSQEAFSCAECSDLQVSQSERGSFDTNNSTVGNCRRLQT